MADAPPSVDGGAPQLGPPPDDPLLGCLDEAVVRGRQPVLVARGWAHRARNVVARVEIQVDGTTVARAWRWRPRPDLAVALGMPDAAMAGFEVAVALRRPPDPSRPPVVGAVVFFLDGSLAELPPRVATLESGVGAGPAPAATAAVVAGPGPAPAPRRLGRRRRRRTARLLWAARTLDRGGSQLRMAEILAHLAAEGGVHNTVVSPVDGPTRAAVEATGGEVVITGAVPLDDPAGYEQAVDRLGRWAGGRFDAVVGPTVTAFPLIDVARRLGLPSVLRVGEAEPLRTVVGWVHGVLDPAVEHRAREALEAATCVVFNSRAARGVFEDAGLRVRAEVLSTGAHLPQGDPGPAGGRAEARAALGIPADRRLLVCAGTVWPVKGQGALVHALRHVHPRHPELLCVLVGQTDYEYARPLAAFADRHGLAGSFCLVPYTSDLGPWWRAADVVVCPSESESMPAAVLEGLAHGRPVAAARVGGVGEAVVDGANGWLYEANDLAAAVAVLDRVAACPPDELERMGAAGARMVAAHHDRAATLRGFASIVRAALDA